MTRRLAALLAAVGLCLPGVAASGADFTAASASPGNAFATATDFNTVAVALPDPGTPLHGDVALTAVASSERGIADVRFESAPAGSGTWTAICTDTTAPYACSWDTTATAGGSRDVRAVATDAAGYSRTSLTGGRMVDNADPTVALQDPGPWLQGIRTISATAADAHAGVSTLTLEYRQAGAATWTQLCTGGGTSRSCALDSAAEGDGDLDLRAVAVDAAGHSAATTLTRRADNTAPSVDTVDPGVLRGAATITATADDGAGTGVASILGEYRLGGAATWTVACTDTTAPYSCSIDTTGANGSYEIRSTATDATGLTTVSPVLTGVIDNTAPATATLVNPGTTLQGTVAVTGTATDAGSGIASWTLQYRTAGGGTWTDACSDTSSPYGCSWSTTGVADALYDLQAVATDAGGLTLASAIATSRRVDNLGPAVVLADPGSPRRGTVTLTATASDAAGMASVIFQRRPSGGATWTTMCTDTTSAWSCSWNTTGVADGLYDVQARATDALGHVSTSMVGARQVDNTAPAPLDVQGGNGGVALRPDTGDWLRFSWNEAVAPASVRTGWNGSALAVLVNVANSGSRDTLTITPASGGGTVNLLGAALALNADVVSAATVFDATMVQSGTTITVTLGARRSGTVRNGASRTMTWTPTALTKDIAGNASPATAVTETGTADADF
jgi:hypothetical protein